MDYKVIEMHLGNNYYFNYEPKKREFITTFQNEVNKYLNDGYIPTGGINVLLSSVDGLVHFAQALIKS
jgi:hypothetical protein